MSEPEQQAQQLTPEQQKALDRLMVEKADVPLLTDFDLVDAFRAGLAALGAVAASPDEATVERVAKALYDAQGKQHGGYERDVPRKGMQTYRSFEWEELAEIDKSGVREHARAALDAAAGCLPEDEKEPQASERKER